MPNYPGIRPPTDLTPRYSQFYQIVFAPFYPLIDEEELEEVICFYLESTSDRAQSKGSNNAQSTKQLEMGRLGLLLAILARGSQLSDAPAVERARTAREYSKLYSQIVCHVFH
jgi:hypothetical protein